MTHAHTHHHTPSILAIALATALALSSTTAPASARTFDFNTTGSMVQQPLPPQWACTFKQASTISFRPSTVRKHQPPMRRQSTGMFPLLSAQARPRSPAAAGITDRQPASSGTARPAAQPRSPSTRHYTPKSALVSGSVGSPDTAARTNQGLRRRRIHSGPGLLLQRAADRQQRRRCSPNGDKAGVSLRPEPAVSGGR